MAEQKVMSPEEKAKAEEAERQRKRANRRKNRAHARAEAASSGRKLGAWRGTFAKVKRGPDAGRRWHVKLGLETDSV